MVGMFNMKLDCNKRKAIAGLVIFRCEPQSQPMLFTALYRNLLTPQRVITYEMNNE